LIAIAGEHDASLKLSGEGNNVRAITLDVSFREISITDLSILVVHIILSDFQLASQSIDADVVQLLLVRGYILERLLLGFLPSTLSRRLELLPRIIADDLARLGADQADDVKDVGLASLVALGGLIDMTNDFAVAVEIAQIVGITTDVAILRASCPSRASSRNRLG